MRHFPISKHMPFTTQPNKQPCHMSKSNLNVVKLLAELDWMKKHKYLERNEESICWTGTHHIKFGKKNRARLNQIPLYT